MNEMELSKIEETNDEMNFEIKDIHLLLQYGINITDIEKLKAAGFRTIKGLIMTAKKHLCNIKGLSETKVDKIKEACYQINQINFSTAAEVYKFRRNIFRLSTGSEEFDNLLGGGIESMSITEVFGEFRSGKTQLAHTLCVTAQISNNRIYNGGKAIFIDTEYTFRPERIASIADRFSLEKENVLENVLYARAFTTDHQYEFLDYVVAKFYEEKGLFRVLIIDSIMALFRVDYNGRGELAERQQKLARIMSRLQKISEEFNIAVFITNQVTADPGSNLLFQANSIKPIGGNIIGHASTTRILLRKGKGNCRIAKIYDSPSLPESEIIFAITEGGIDDPLE